MKAKRSQGRVNGWRWLARCWLVVGLAVTGFLFLRAMSAPPRGKASQVAPHLSAATGAAPAINLPDAAAISEPVRRRVLKTQAIETIQVGQRVLGTNPQRDQVEEYQEPDQKTWRVIEVEQTKPNGKKLYATLLRPQEWLEEEIDPETCTIGLDLPEMGVEGEARVLRMGLCPAIKPGSGQVVTATFKHQPDGALLDITIAGETIGCTANHPFWSEDRREFVKAGKLRVGEKVRTRLDEIVAITNVKPRPPTEWVYNLEVQGEHVYEVGGSGTLVHNKCEGFHHFFPRSWENLIPYRHRVLTWLNAAEHTDVHKQLSQILFNRTGHYFNSMPGREWVRQYGKHQLNRWLHEFYREYSKTSMGQAIQQRLGHSVYDLFKAEYRYALRRGFLNLRSP